MSQTLQVRGWRAVPNQERGYDIYAPGSYDTFRGWAPSAESAIEWLDEASGAAYDRLPAVRESDLRIERGKPWRERLFGVPTVVRHTHYYLGEKSLGFVQTKTQHGRTTVLTCVNQYCVVGSDLRWLLKENGYRLVRDQNAR